MAPVASACSTPAIPHSSPAAKTPVPARALRRVHDHALGRRLAAEQARQLEVRHEAEAAGEHVALPLPLRPAVGQDHPLDARVAERLADPGARAVRRRRAASPRSRAPRRACAGWRQRPAPKAASRGEGACSAIPTTRAPAAPQGRRHREEERPRARHDDAQAVEARPGLQQRLRPADADDARERPAGEGEEQLARARREHEALEADAERQRRRARRAAAFGPARPPPWPPRATVAPERARRSSHARAAGGGSPRQTWPPGRACSSRSRCARPPPRRGPPPRSPPARRRRRPPRPRGAIRRPEAPSARVGARRAPPRGPADSSSPVDASPRNDTDLHPLADRLEARAAVRLAVDRDPALEAGAHAAQRAARLAAHRRAHGATARVPQRGQEARPGLRPRRGARRA